MSDENEFKPQMIILENEKELAEVYMECLRSTVKALRGFHHYCFMNNHMDEARAKELLGDDRFYELQEYRDV